MHTQGPWHVGVKTAHHGRDIYGPLGESVAITDNVLTDEATAKDNARLIAAAPDLLEKARALVWQMDRMDVEFGEDCEAMVDDLRAAIAKATT